MSYQAVYLVEHGYREDPYRFVNADMDGAVCFEPWDGLRVRRYFADALYLYRKKQDGHRTEEVLFYGGRPIEFLVTDARITLRVPEYKMTHHRDDTMAAVMRSGSSGQTYSREMTLMGMIRYEWVSRISYQRKISRGTEECLRLYYNDLTQSKWYLDLVFHKAADAEFLANEILHRACSYRLNMTDEKNDKELYFFNHYLRDYEIEPADDPKSYMSSIVFPTQYPAPGGGDARPVL